MFKLLLIVLGLIALFIAGLGGITERPKINFGWLGLALIGCGLYLPLP